MTEQETRVNESQADAEGVQGTDKSNAPKEVAPAEYWEARYGSAEKMWSGRVNQVLAHTVSEFDPGRALDLGCGEGGDVVWLAKRGWHATGIDISDTAIQRARAAAHAAGLTEAQANFRVADLAELAALDLDPEEWDTVIAQTRDREAVAPDGAHVVLTDGIVLVRRRAAAVPQ